jgi:hypothetical protein
MVAARESIVRKRHSADFVAPVTVSPIFPVIVALPVTVALPVIVALFVIGGFAIGDAGPLNHLHTRQACFGGTI